MLALILAAVGTLGVGGFVALAVFAPPIAAQVAKAAWDIFERVWSTRLGVGLVAGGACLIAGDLYGDHQATARVKAEWRAAEQRAVERGNNARSESEAEIPPVATEGEPAAAPPPGPKWHIPFIHPKEPDHEACPPPVAAAACPPAKRRPVDRMLRGDPDNRDRH